MHSKTFNEVTQLKDCFNTVSFRSLNGYLSDINNQAEAMFIRQAKEMAEKQGVNEALKAENQMEWAGRTNNICNQATEFVNSELI